VYPASRGRCELRTTVRSVLGVRIQDSPPAPEPASTPVSGSAPAPRVSGSAKGLEPNETTGVAADAPGISDAPGATSTDLQTPEGEQCRARFDALLPIAARLAVLTGNLERLRREYIRTARRARALEDVLLPEIDARLDGIETALEELEREESVRVRRVVR
jgi:V/A-type H+-transporting ATPase subunit D